VNGDFIQVESEDRIRGEVVVKLLNQRLRLLPERALFWEEEKLLVVSDAHFGKIGAFRAQGIALPPSAARADADRLRTLVVDWSPRECLFLGDLFHHRHNDEWDLLKRILQENSAIKFSLVLGNHDILDPDIFREAGLMVYGDRSHIGPFCFSHEKMSPVYGYNVFGHLHPGVHLHGPGGDSIRLPAFVFRPRSAILPAFGGFTGTMVVPGEPQTRSFVIGDGRIFALGG
jgi:uncharacterized protein